MEVGAYLVADAEPFELMQPGEGALDDPSSLAQPGAVRGATAGDLGCDPASPDEAPVLVEVIAAVGEQPPGPLPGRPRRPRMCGMASSKGMSWVTS